MNSLTTTTAQLPQRMKSPNFLDVLNHHQEACRSFLNSDTCEGQDVDRKTYPEFVSTTVDPKHHSKVSLLFLYKTIFLVHTAGTCLGTCPTHEMPDFTEDKVKFVSPRTIIIDVSDYLSDKDLSSSVLEHELVDTAFPRSVYHIKVRISSGTRSQEISISINTNKLGEDETYPDGSVRKNIIIDQTGIVPPLVKSDGIAFLAEVLNDDSTIEQIEPGKEVVGSILFGPVLTS